MGELFKIELGNRRNRCPIYLNNNPSNVPFNCVAQTSVVAIELVEAAAQIYRRGGDQHPRRAGDAQHGSARNSSSKEFTSESF
jgi:hypothetical protein